MPRGIPKSGTNAGWIKKGQKPWNTGTKGVVKPNSGSFKKGMIPWSKGKSIVGHKQTEETKKKISESRQFNKNYNWKGDKVGYSALHKWVYKKLGKAKECSDCGRTDGLIEWCNISDEYKRDVNDWEQLCRRCHMVKDGRLEKLNPSEELSRALGESWDNSIRKVLLCG